MKKGIFRPNASAGYMEHLSYFNFKPSKPLRFINISGISCFDCHQPCTIKVCFELLLEDRSWLLKCIVCVTWI